MDLANPGEIIVYDFRSKDAVSSLYPSSSSSSIPSSSRPLRAIQWNIERGYQLPLIIDELRRLDPDVAILQEIDIGCQRSGGGNHHLEICRELGWRGGMVCEFWELASPQRDAKSQGGGIHGNAIYSKFDVDFRVVMHKCHPVDWEREGEKMREPRRGERYTLAAQVYPPVGVGNAHVARSTYSTEFGANGNGNGNGDMASSILLNGSYHNISVINANPPYTGTPAAEIDEKNPISPLPMSSSTAVTTSLVPDRLYSSPILCYSAHLEVFCGITGRVGQLADIFEDSAANVEQFPYQLLFGDLNTLGHSIARLSPRFCADTFRWRSLFWSESEWLDYHVLQVLHPAAFIGVGSKVHSFGHSSLTHSSRLVRSLTVSDVSEPTKQMESSVVSLAMDDSGIVDPKNGRLVKSPSAAALASAHHQITHPHVPHATAPFPRHLIPSALPEASSEPPTPAAEPENEGDVDAILINDLALVVSEAATREQQQQQQQQQQSLADGDMSTATTLRSSPSIDSHPNGVSITAPRANPGSNWASGILAQSKLPDPGLTSAVPPNPRLLYYGRGLFSKDVARRARNPGFYEPWDVSRDVTVENHFGFFRGKLDWTLVRGFQVVAKSMGNSDYSMSDHKWLMVDLEYDIGATSRRFPSRTKATIARERLLGAAGGMAAAAALWCAYTIVFRSK